MGGERGITQKTEAEILNYKLTGLLKKTASSLIYRLISIITKQIKANRNPIRKQFARYNYLISYTA